MRKLPIRLILCAAVSSAVLGGSAESGSGAYPTVDKLPKLEGLSDPFLGPDGKRISKRSQWPAQREHLKALMTHYQYGRMPPKPSAHHLSDRKREVMLDGAALRESFRLTISRGGRSVSIGLGVVRPNRAGRFPLIIKNDTWLFSLSEIVDAGSAERLAKEGRDNVDVFAFREAVRRGYAICKFNREDVARDLKDNRGTGVFPLYPEAEYDWGTIAAWAWAYQVIIDALTKESWVDAERIVATGHSRGGKTALCAAIYDERIAIAAPSASGSGGTGSWRFFEPGRTQQDVADMFRQHPHWFGPNLRQFAGREGRLPVDGHTAKALIALRPLLNTHGRDDNIANPLGTQATFEAAQVVYDWLGKPDNQGLHWRPGGHGQLEVDWLALFDFCDRHFFGKPVTRDLRQMPHPGQKRMFNWRAPAAR